MNNYNRVTDEMNQADWRRTNEELTILDSHIIGNNHLNITVKNTGNVQSVIEWIGIFNQSMTPEGQWFFSANIPVAIGETQAFNSGEEGIFNSTFKITPNQKYLVQLVTKEGNVYVFTLYPASQANLALSLIAVPATVYQGNNITLFATVTNINQDDIIAKDLTLQLTIEPPNLTQQILSPISLTINSLPPGSSTFFTWTYTTTTGATEDKTVTFTTTLNPNGASASASVTIKPQPTGTGGQGQVTITGISSIQPQKYHPSSWETIGATRHFSGTVSSLTSADSDVATFGAYQFATSSSSNVDGFANVGTLNNFAAMQALPNGDYATLTEQTATAPSSTFGNSNSANAGNTPIGNNEMCGGKFNSGITDAQVNSITFYGRANPTGGGHSSIQAKAVLCNNLGQVLGVSASTAIQTTLRWYTITFTTPINITPDTQYWLMIISGGNYIEIQYSSANGGHGVNSKDTFTTIKTNDYLNPVVEDNRLYCIYASTTGKTGYHLDYEIQWTNVETTNNYSYLDIYLHSKTSSEGLTVAIWSNGNWQPLSEALSIGWNHIDITNYVSSTVTIRFRSALPYDSSISAWQIKTACIEHREQSSIYKIEVEFTGLSNLNNWLSLTWTIENWFKVSDATVTIAFWNDLTQNYYSSGSGYDESPSVIGVINSVSKTVNPYTGGFKDENGEWKVKITVQKATTIPFNLEVDKIELQPTQESDGNIISYDAIQAYTITATNANGQPMKYAQASIYTDGSNVILYDSADDVISYPAWILLDSAGQYSFSLKSNSTTSETFNVYVYVGTVLGQKTVTQEAQ